MFKFVAQCIGFIVLLFLLTFLTLRVIVQRCLKRKRISVPQGGQFLFTVAFFHPYCNAGGGGERVLWVAVQALQKKYPDILCVIYTGDEGTPEEFLERAKQRFNVEISHHIHFVRLRHRSWVEASCYPYFTLLGQSLGSLLLGVEALLHFVPDIFFDSMGYAFTMPLFRYIGGCKVGCYTHYPTISTDMLNLIYKRRESHNNPSYITRNPFLSFMKLIYYRLFAGLYGLAGRSAHVVMVNSSWTKRHISQLWAPGERLFLVYPPCNVDNFKNIPLSEAKIVGKWKILSIAQFRPEKDHALQIKAFAEFQNGREDRGENILIMIGSCRSKEDSDRVEDLKRMCQEYGVSEEVLFMLNISFEDLKEQMATSSVGLHTMWNEHFGIGVVECMASGLLMLAHDSGGPKMDIVVEHEGTITGFLANNVESYAQAISKLKNMSLQEAMEIKIAARKSVDRFSDQIFQQKFLSSLETIL